MSNNNSSILTDSDTVQAFVAGALVPTIAYYCLWRRQKQEYAHALAAAVPQADDDDDNSSDDDDDDFTERIPRHPDALPCAQWGLRHAPFKMVFCVNTELSMGKGKIAAQVGHAAIGCFRRATRTCPAALQAWERTGCAKIALKCHDLERVAAAAAARDIPLYLVVDAGRTQIAAGSRTVLGLFGPTFVFEGVTDHLKLM